MFVRRRKGERFSQGCVKSTVKHPQGQMIWGCFSYYGVGELFQVDKTVNAEVYLKVLYNNFIPFLETHLSNTDQVIFQDDSAPYHRAKTVSRIFI